jgi:hypothetical protein
MTSKERVHAVLEGNIPDRVPIGEFAVDFDTVEKIIGHETFLRAKAKSQLAFWAGRHDEVAQSYLEDHLTLHKKLDLDIVTFPMATWEIPLPSHDPPPRRINDNTWEDRFGRIYKYSECTADITCVHDPVMQERVYTEAEFDIEPSLPALDPRSWTILNSAVQALKNEKFICGPSGGEVGIVLLGNMELGLMRLIEEPALVRKATDYYLRTYNLADETWIHPDADAVLWGHDFAFKTGPFISPTMFADFFLEPNKQRVQRIKKQFGKKVMKHCCGNTWSLLDYFVEIGYDAYQSIQPTADMDICRVKQKYGDKLTLWGGVAVEHLISGSQEEVRQDVRTAMQCAKKGGRFILGASHSIAVGSRYDNYMAMLDEYHKTRNY